MYLGLKNKLSEFQNDRLAIVHGNQKISYPEFLNLIETDFLKLSKSIEKQSTVVVFGDYSIKSLTLFFALCKLKCIIVPILSTKEEEIRLKVSISKAQYTIDSNTFEIKQTSNENIEDCLYQKLQESDNSGLILFSSGSTGEPKAMLHDLDRLIESYLQNKQKRLNFLIFLLFDHIGGLNTMLNILTMGSTMVIPAERTPETVSKCIEENRVNILPTSPTFLNLMIINNVFDKYDFSSLKLITYGTEPMPLRVLNEIKKRLPRTKLLQTFGTSETGIIKTVSKSSESLLLKFEDKDQETKIVHGELWIKSKTRILGYLNYESESFNEDGWFKTGDLVEETEEGYLKIIGRKSQFINVGGEKVLPIEVENVILKIKEITSCTVYAIDSPITGQTVGVKIYVSDKSLDQKVLKRKVKELCKIHLERYKIPSKITFIEEIEYSPRFKKSLS